MGVPVNGTRGGGTAWPHALRGGWGAGKGSMSGTAIESMGLCAPRRGGGGNVGTVGTVYMAGRGMGGRECPTSAGTLVWNTGKDELSGPLRTVVPKVGMGEAVVCTCRAGNTEAVAGGAGAARGMEGKIDGDCEAAAPAEGEGAAAAVDAGGGGVSGRRTRRWRMPRMVQGCGGGAGGGEGKWRKVTERQYTRNIARQQRTSRHAKDACLGAKATYDFHPVPEGSPTAAPGQATGARARPANLGVTRRGLRFR